MKKMFLDEEERDLVESIERGEWKSVKNLKAEIQKHQDYARNTLRKDKRVNIRLSARDLESLQSRAVEDGIPYQTLMASVLHRFAAGRLKEA
jgi:predicted DNA binding CopG/RHH family protein